MREDREDGEEERDAEAYELPSNRRECWSARVGRKWKREARDPKWGNKTFPRVINKWKRKGGGVRFKEDWNKMLRSVYLTLL